MSSPRRPAQAPPSPSGGLIGVHPPQNSSCENPACVEEAGGPIPRPAAEDVFREHAPRVYHLALRMVGSEADAEDVAQEVLLRVVRELDTLRGGAALATWLSEVTANVALALRRKRAARRECRTAGPPAVRPAEQAAGAELRGLIGAAVEGLPGLYREVYVLADLDGLANADIGRRLGLSLPAVKSRLHRARLLLRDALAPHFEEISV